MKTTVEFEVLDQDGIGQTVYIEFDHENDTYSVDMQDVTEDGVNHKIVLFSGDIDVILPGMQRLIAATEVE